MRIFYFLFSCLFIISTNKAQATKHTKIGENEYLGSHNSLPLPVANFIVDLGSDCTFGKKNFINQSIGENLTYQWNFGDPSSGGNNFSTDTLGRHQFIGVAGNATQTFFVKLIVTDSLGFIDSIEKPITLKQSPDLSLLGGVNGVLVAPISYSSSLYFSDCSNSTPNPTFTFKNNSSTIATNTNYSIDWGDGSSKYINANFNTELTHQYQSGKIYDLKYTVFGGNGCKNILVYKIMVGTKAVISMGTISKYSYDVGDEISIPVIGASQNTPGTTYKINYSDGITERPIAPEIIKRTYNKSSFGQTATLNNITYKNAYAVNVQANNVCGPTKFDVGPFYVSDKQEAIFTPSVSDPSCTNNVLKLTYTDSLGNSVSNTGDGYSNRIIWKITPTNGYIISEGNLGTDKNNADPYNWESGSKEVCIKFTNNGKYTITLLTGTANEIKTSPVHTHVQAIDYDIKDNPAIVFRGQVPDEIIGKRMMEEDMGFTYNWEVSADKNSWQRIDGATGQNYQPGSLFQSSFFRRITNAGNCQLISSIATIKVFNGLNNTFSPNGDGINDTWDISGYAANSKSKVQVFNRFGQIVFQNANNEMYWTGQYKGADLPAGVYYYIISENNEKPLSGWVNIIY